MNDIKRRLRSKQPWYFIYLYGTVKEFKKKNYLRLTKFKCEIYKEW